LLFLQDDPGDHCWCCVDPADRGGLVCLAFHEEEETQGSRREGGSLIFIPAFYLFLAIKCTDKKENSFSSYIRKFRVEQLQSHI
jgi:hypothetical protein